LSTQTLKDPQFTSRHIGQIDIQTAFATDEKFSIEFIPPIVKFRHDQKRHSTCHRLLSREKITALRLREIHPTKSKDLEKCFNANVYFVREYVTAKADSNEDRSPFGMTDHPRPSLHGGENSRRYVENRQGGVGSATVVERCLLGA
jgi:hypothetical protein